LQHTSFLLKSAARDVCLHLYPALVIGHTEKAGAHRIYSQPFAQEKRKTRKSRSIDKTWCLCDHPAHH